MDWYKEVKELFAMEFLALLAIMNLGLLLGQVLTINLNLLGAYFQLEIVEYFIDIFIKIKEHKK